MLRWLTKNTLAFHEMFILVCDFVMVTILHRFNIITGISISKMVFAANHTCNSTQKHNKNCDSVCMRDQMDEGTKFSFLLLHLL